MSVIYGQNWKLIYRVRSNAGSNLGIKFVEHGGVLVDYLGDRLEEGTQRVEFEIELDESFADFGVIALGLRGLLRST
jgi:hypothetical protein